MNVAGTDSSSISYSEQFGDAVVKSALARLGAPYVYGSTGPYTFDCSGFTGWVYRANNVSLPRTSRMQSTIGTRIASIKDLKKGDLVFFGGRATPGSVGHVGIVKEVDPSGENFYFIHASTRYGVKLSCSSEGYYKRRYLGARRVVLN